MEIDKSFGSLLVTNEFSHYEDVSMVLSPFLVLGCEFVPCDGKIPNMGFSHSAHWFKVDCIITAPSDTMLVYDIRNHYLEHVEIYLITDSIRLLQQGGAASKKLAPDAVVLSPLQKATFLIKVVSRSPIRLPFYLHSNEHYWHSFGLHRLLSGIYYGVFGVLVILGLYLLVTYREWIYLTFGLSALAWLWLIIGLDNNLPIMRHWHDPALLLKSSSFATPFSALLYVVYSYQFFNTTVAWIRRLLLGVAVMLTLFMIVYFFDYFLANQLSYFIVPVLAFLVLVVSSYLFFVAKVKYVRHHLVGAVVLFVGVALHMMSYIGVIGNYWVMQLSFKTSFLILICTIVLALLDKYIITQQNFMTLLQSTVAEKTTELRKANLDLHDNNIRLNDAYQMLSTYKEDLERVVEERTEALINALSSLQSVINSSPLAIFDLDREKRILSVWNQAAEKLFGWESGEVLGRNLVDFNLAFWEKNNELVDEIDSGHTVPSFETTGVNKWGEKIDLRIALAPITEDSGGRLIAMVDNITERKQLMGAIESSELKFRTLFESISLGILLLDASMVVVEHNPAVLRIFGYPRDYLNGQSLFSLFDAFFHEKISKAHQDLSLKGKLPHFEFDTFDANGQSLVVDVWGSFMALGNQELVLVVVNDITEQKRFNQKILETILATEEKERRRFAGDLHDELGPQLASMRIYASSLKKRAVGSEELEILDILMELIKRTIENVRELSNNLSPHLLDTYGMVSAIGMELERLALKFHTNLVHNLESKRLPNNVEVNVYRIVKELLNNSMKYAQASNVTIVMELGEKSLKMVYSDDGVGFDYESIIQQGSVGIGLMNIKSRVDSLAGECEFQSKQGQGFRFMMSVPVGGLTF